MPVDESQSYELVGSPKMNRIKRLFEQQPAYEPIASGIADEHDEEDDDRSIAESEDGKDTPFSWIEYLIFLLLGVAMLWAWNMFLAAAPYFQHRFRSNEWIVNHFQAAEISVSTITNLISMIILSKMQKNASYPRRISLSLTINIITFTILALSTLVMTSASAYFGFLLIVILAASLSTALIQNGLFAFSTGFGRSEYTQAIMTGQAIAGVMPPLTQIISVLVVSSKHKDDPEAASESPTSAFIYFLTATTISVIALLAFFYLLRRKAQSDALTAVHKTTINGTTEADIIANSHQSILPEPAEQPSIPLMTLFRKLLFLALGVFACFAVTMIGFPVFTASITSNNPAKIDSSIFIPAAFLIWNVGDLGGRLITLTPKVSLTHYPFALFCISMARLLFIPLYFLCNIKGRGAVIKSDAFYLIVVQLLFGLTNGYLGSQCMMGAGDWVGPEEREAAGGFMGLMLVGGLTAGSLLSFTLGDV